jgi:colanic acid/amylovoran biosynthesis glycosyltransferase
VHVARLVPKKGTCVLIEAFGGIAGRHPGARLVIIGDGPLRAELQAQARSGPAGSRITFTGGLPNDEVVAHLACAAVLAVPSVTAPNGDAEGLPICALEAMACGVPVVASRHGGIPEAVVDGSTGSLVEERDVGGLGQRLSALLDDAALRERMARAGRATVLERFDIRRNSRVLESLYDELLLERETRTTTGDESGAEG